MKKDSSIIPTFSQFLEEGVGSVSPLLRRATEDFHKAQLELQKLQSEFVAAPAEERDKLRAAVIAQNRVVRDREARFNKALGDEDIEDFDVNESRVHEGDEISIDMIMTPAQKRALKAAFENTPTGVDSVSFKKGGTVVAKSAFFYTHGMDADKLAMDLQRVLASQGIPIEIVDAYDDWKPWPKTSNFVVEFRLDKSGISTK